MAKFFSKVSESATEWFDGLTDRERKLLGILFIGLCLIILLTAYFIASGRIESKRAQVATDKKILNQIIDLEQDYQVAKEKNQAALQGINSNNISLFSLVSSRSKRLGFTIKDLNESKRTLPKSKVEEVSVRINLTKLSIDKLSALIEEFERPEPAQRGQVRVTRLKVSKRYDEPDLLDVQMTVTTWKSA